MKDFLRKIKLVDSFTTEIEIEKSVFVNTFRKYVDEGSTGLWFSSFEAFSSSKNEFKGNVGFDGFKIRRRSRLFDMNGAMAIAQGTFRQKDNVLVIDTEINGFHGMFIPYYLFVSVFYAIFIVMTILGGNNFMPFFIFPFIIIHAAFIFGIPYLIMRRSTRRMKYDLEREFYYMTRK